MRSEVKAAGTVVGDLSSVASIVVAEWVPGQRREDRQNAVLFVAVWLLPLLLLSSLPRTAQ